MPVVCPVCGASVPDDAAAEHVNRCLDGGPPDPVPQQDQLPPPPAPGMTYSPHHQPFLQQGSVVSSPPPPQGQDMMSVTQCSVCTKWVSQDKFFDHMWSDHPDAAALMNLVPPAQGSSSSQGVAMELPTVPNNYPAPPMGGGWGQQPLPPPQQDLPPMFGGGGAVLPPPPNMTPPPPQHFDEGGGGMGQRQVSLVECPMCTGKVARTEAQSHINRCLDGGGQEDIVDNSTSPPPPTSSPPPPPAGDRLTYPPPPAAGGGQAMNDIFGNDDSQASIYRSRVSSGARLPPALPSNHNASDPPSSSSWVHLNHAENDIPPPQVPAWDSGEDNLSSGVFGNGGLGPRQDSVQMCPLCGASIDQIAQHDGVSGDDASTAFVAHVQRCMDEAEGGPRQPAQAPTSSVCPYCGKDIPADDFVRHASQCLAESEAQIFCALCNQWKPPGDIYTFDCRWNHKFCLRPCAQNLVFKAVEHTKKLLQCPLCNDQIPSTDIVNFYGGEKTMASGKFKKFLDQYKALELAKSLENFTRCPTPGCAGLVELPQNPNADAGVVDPDVKEWVHATCPTCELPFCYIRNGRNISTIQTAVMDLYVNFTKAGVHSSRWEMIFNPFPTASDPATNDVLKPAANENEKPNIALAIKVIDQIPAMSTLVSADRSQVVDVKRSICSADLHPLTYSLYSWILTSHKAEMSLIPKSHQIKCMGTPYQFILTTGPPEAEKQFQLLKKKHGAKFAFHGSRAENWHSILHNGLRNASGTKLQVNGARYGSGVYLSPKASVSFDYSQISKKDSAGGSAGSEDGHFFDHKSMHCIAVTECADHKIQVSNGGTIWVQPNEACVQTRFLFVYQHGDSAGSTTDLADAGVKKQFTKALEVIKM